MASVDGRVKMYKYTNTQIHKYTNTQVHKYKYTNTQIQILSADIGCKHWPALSLLAPNTGYTVLCIEATSILYQVGTYKGTSKVKCSSLNPDKFCVISHESHYDIVTDQCSFHDVTTDRAVFIAAH